MFAKLETKLPCRWLCIGILLSSLGVCLFSTTSFFIGVFAVFLSSLVAQLFLTTPFRVFGIQRYWLQLISAQACKWLVFGIIIYWTISYKYIDASLFMGIIAAQLIVFWNYRKYG
ncbi:MAG: hypothetical protein P8L77_00995 [Gammaproteobacteria bacterium]|nr:hypothetical protein [Gammaproteobacteria bacterium]